MLDHIAALFLAFWGISILFSVVAAPIYRPTNNCSNDSCFLSILTFVICRCFWNDLRRIDISSCFFLFVCFVFVVVVGRIPLWSCLILDSSLLGIFVCLFELQNQFHYLWSVCSDSVSSWFSLGCLYVSRILSIFPGCPVHWHITLSLLSWFFVSLCYQLLFLLFHFLLCLLVSLSFLFGKPV